MRSIVVGVRADREVEVALDLAVEEAVRRRLPLDVVHAYSLQAYGEVPLDLSGLQATAEERTAAALERSKARVAGGSTVQSRLLVKEGDPVTCVTGLADTAALVVLGSRGLGSWGRALRGSVSAGCLHRCLGPVVVVPDTAELPADRWLRSRVVVGLDGSPASLSALLWGAAQASEWGSALVPVVVLGEDGQPPVGLRDGPHLTAVVWKLMIEAGCGDVEAHPRIVQGHLGDQLRAVVREEDLLVLGSRGRSGLAGLLPGGTTTEVAESARCPVAVVRTGQARREIHQRRTHYARG